MIENATILISTVSSSLGGDIIMMSSVPILPIWAVMLIAYGSPILGMALGFLVGIWDDRKRKA